MYLQVTSEGKYLIIKRAYKKRIRETIMKKKQLVIQFFVLQMLVSLDF